MDEVRAFQKQLKEIEANLEEHPQALPASYQGLEEQYLEKIRNVSYDVDAPLPGREIVLDLLTRNMLFCEIIMKKCVESCPCDAIGILMNSSDRGGSRKD